MTQIRRRVEGLQRRKQIAQLLRDADATVDLTVIAHQIGVHRNTARFHLEALVKAGQVEQVAAGGGVRGRPRMLYRSVRGWDPAGPRRYQALAMALLEHLRQADDPSDAADRAGFSWGAQLADDELMRHEGETAGEALVRGLEQLDFAPEPGRPASDSVTEDVADTSSCGGLRDAIGPVASRNPPHVAGADHNPPHVSGHLSDRENGAGHTEQLINLRHCPFQELSDDEDQLICHLHAGMLRGTLHAWRTPTQLVTLEPMVEPGRCVVRLASAAAP